MRRFSLIAPLAAALALGAPALAQDWVLDEDASQIRFETQAFGSTVEGGFEDFSAEITLDPDNLDAARIHAVVQTGSAIIGNSDYRETLRGRAGLNVSGFPEAVFDSSSITREGETYRADGMLTIKGEDNPAVLTFTLEITGDRAVANGEMTVMSRSFGVGANDWDGAGEEVTLQLHIEADAAQE